MFEARETLGGGRKLRYRGVRRNRFWAELNAAAYNLVRIARHGTYPGVVRPTTPTHWRLHGTYCGRRA